MEMLGLTLIDLLVPNNITKLIVEATGNQDAMSIVTDSDLSAALMDTMSFLDEQLAEVSGELDIPVEDLNGLIFYRFCKGQMCMSVNKCCKSRGIGDNF